MINREGGFNVCRVFVRERERKLSASTHSIRQTDVTVGMVRTAAVDLMRIAGLFHHHRAGLHRFWSAGQQHKEHTLLYSQTLITKFDR